MNIGESLKYSKNRMLTTIAYRLDGLICYALEGSIFIAGAAIQWLRDNLGVLQDASESEALAVSVEDNNDVYFVPAFTGLGAPYWEPDARAMICGLSRESNKAHIVRAALEAQAYQTRDLMGAMIEDSGVAIDTLRIDGGLAANGFMCQFLADMLDVNIDVPAVIETTAWGAACLAGLSCGVFKSLDDISDQWAVERGYSSQMNNADRDTLYDGWKNAVKMLR